MKSPLTSLGCATTLAFAASVAALPAKPLEPAALAGTRTRTVTDDDVKKPASGEAPPAWRWKLVFDRVGAWVLDPKGSGVVEAYASSPSTIRAIAPIQIAPFRDGKGGISRFGHHGIGGTVCRDDGPPGTWAWSVAGNELTLTPVHDPAATARRPGKEPGAASASAGRKETR